MNKEAVQQQLTEALSKRLGDGFQVSVQKCVRTNLEADGLMIWRGTESIAATIYLEPFYEGLEHGMSIDEAAERILQVYHNAEPCSLDFDVSSIKDFSNVKDRLYVQLINRHFNQKLLVDVPHTLFLDDFAVTVRCGVSIASDEHASFLVHNGHLKAWHIDQETLFDTALRNTRTILGVQLGNLNDFLLERFPEKYSPDTPPNPLWILTNKKRTAGAATALFDDVLKNFAEEHGNFYVIFSSVHELLLVPKPDASDMDEITSINMQVNAEYVAADEILGTKAYFYKKGIGFVL